MFYLYQIFICIFTYKCIQEYYNNPDLYKNYVIQILYQIIKFYSKCEIIYNIYLNPHIKKIYYFFYKKDLLYLRIEFFNNGILVNKDIINIKKDIYLLKEEYEPENYDLIIYSHYEKQLNKVCYKHFPTTLNYDVSNITFLSLTLLYKNKHYEIELCNSKYNFYIVNNVIDNIFLLYFIRYIKKESDLINIDDFKYKLVLIDNNVQIYNLDETDKIIIAKLYYSIDKKVE
jgi:hypothetical protein